MTPAAHSFFQRILADLERDRFAEASLVVSLARQSMDRVCGELERMVRSQGIQVNAYLGCGTFEEAVGQLSRIHSLAETGSTCYVFGAPGANFPGGGGVHPVIVMPPELQNDRFLVIQGPEFAAAFLGEITGPLDEDPEQQELRCLMSLDRKVVGMVAARLNQLILHRHVVVAPAPRPAVSFAADVARARAGTSLLTGLAGQLDTLERKSREIALTDDLTGLYNRRFFYRQLVREVNRFKRYERPFTIVFAEIQESIPHPEETPYRASREALRNFASVLRERIRNGVDLAFRLQSNEFAALLIDSGERQAAGVAVRLENAFSKLGFAGLTLKIGISEFSSDQAIHSVLSYAKKRLRSE